MQQQAACLIRDTQQNLKMKINNQIVAASAEYVSELLVKQLPESFCYHNYFHTFTVVNAVDMLCTANAVSRQEKRILLVAAWFHDTGYTKQMDGHEQAGAAIAEEFLKQNNIDADEIDCVKACILATQFPQHPQNNLEQILCDADMLHLSESNFIERSNLLREEWGATKTKTYSDKEWYELNIEFLSNHSFQTAYCRQQYEAAKKKNITRLQKKLETINHSNSTALEVKSKKEKKEKPPRLERGVETLFKITSGNHIKLSAMADNKAHILLSINSIIISVTLSLLAKYLDELPQLIFPTILLLLVCLITIVFAVLTTKPKVSKGIFTAEQIRNKQANLLFFGNFYNMEWESYNWGIQTIMHDKEYLYKSMTKDIYFLGKVLAAKYRYLNIGYKVFMYGLIAAVIAFAISFIGV